MTDEQDPTKVGPEGLRLLGEVIQRGQDVAKEHGFTAVDSYVKPARNGEPSKVTFAFGLDEDWQAPIPVAALEEIAGPVAPASDEAADKSRQELEELRDSLTDPSKGIGLDDD